MIFYGCPNCQTPMSSPDSMAGQRERCPACGNVTLIPLPQMQQPTAPSFPPQQDPLDPLSELAQAETHHATATRSKSRPRKRSTQKKTRSQHVVVEQTSKRIKARMLISGAMIFIGLIVISAGFLISRHMIIVAAGCIITAIGIIWSVILEIQRWWHHG